MNKILRFPPKRVFCGFNVCGLVNLRKNDNNDFRTDFNCSRYSDLNFLAVDSLIDLSYDWEKCLAARLALFSEAYFPIFARSSGV